MMDAKPHRSAVLFHCRQGRRGAVRFWRGLTPARRDRGPGARSVDPNPDPSTVILGYA
jgi:hypothetical protein